MSDETTKIRHHRLTELRINRKTLKAEAHFIKAEEAKMLRLGRKLRKSNRDHQSAYTRFDLLRDHRRQVVRFHARAYHLAHAFLTGRDYKTVEASTREPVKEMLVKEVAKHIRKFENADHSTDVKDVRFWMEGRSVAFVRETALPEATAAE